MRILRKVLFLLFSFLASHSIFSGLLYRHYQRKPGIPDPAAHLPLIAPALSEKTGQQAAPPPGGPNVPEIQTFTALGSDDMVDLFSGDFKYNIPLLDVGGYPVILNYNSNPSINEDASMVGFGWNLNVGSINRNVRGLPDDFSGDAVTEVQSDQADYTITGNLGAQLELFGKNLSLSRGASLSYNYYTGFFTSESFSAGYKLMKFGDVKMPWGKFSAGIDLQSGFSEGLSVSPSLKFSLENYGSIKGKLKISPEKGVKEFGIYTEADYYRYAGMGENGYDGKKNLILEERGSNYKASGGTTFRLKSQDFSPSVVFPRTSYSLNLDASAGVELFGLDAGISTGVSFTRSYIKDNTLTKAGYGYLNAHKAGESDLMDFVRSDEGIVQREKPQLFPVFSTYDVFSISAEGLQTEIRPFRTDIPLLHDAKTESKSGSGGMGLEVSGGNLFKGGGNINGTYSSGENGPWVKHDSGIPSCWPDAAEDACWYFGQTGLQTPEADEQLKENILQGDKPVRFSIQAQTFFNRLEGEIPARTSNFEASLRPKNAPNIAVQALSAKQANGFGLERDIVSYPLNPLSGNASAEKEVLPRYRESELKSAKEHHISEFIVTNSNGNRYHFGIPVYNRSQEEYSFNVSGDFDRIPGSRFIKYRNTGAVGTSNNNGLNSKFKQLSTPAYASGFLLTAILSTDYSDLTGDGPSEDDLGNYTHFKYTRVSDRYRWRIPYGEQTASLSENSSLYTTKDNGDDMAGFTTGEKELWYINAIETRNYIARFYYSPRNDGAGSGNSIHGRSARAAGRDANRLAAEGQALMKLEKIVLFSKTRTPDGSRELPVKTVHFEYDYSLCTNSPDNISNNARDNGKLTLRKVYFVHRESQKSRFSPYIFYYNSSKPYSDLHTDRWNMYKDPEPGFSNEEFPYSFQGEDNYASLWRLNRILLPTGGLIKVDYERDEYALVEDKKAMTMLRIAGFGSRDGAMRQGVQDLNDDLTKIFLHRPAFISREMAETDAQNGGKILGKMFGKLPFLFYEIPIRMGHDDPEKFESINGFLELGENLQFGTDYAYTGSNKEFISIVFNGSLIGSWHPLQMDAFRNAADCHPGLPTTDAAKIRLAVNAVIHSNLQNWNAGYYDPKPDFNIEEINPATSTVLFKNESNKLPIFGSYHYQNFKRYQYRWNFGDGAISDEITPSHSFNALGVYTVKLHAAYKNGSFPDSISRMVRIGGPLLAITAVAENELEMALAGNDSLAFPTLLVGDTTSRIFHVYNHGTEPLTINQLDFGGSSAWSYMLDSTTVKPGRKGILTLRFHPIAAGVTESLLSIQSNDDFSGTFYLNLSGSGIGQNHAFEVYRNNTILPDESVIDYGDPSAPQEIETLLRLKNTGNMPLKIKSVYVTEDTAAFYAVGRSMTLNPGNNQTIPVRFRVTDTLSRTGFLHISTNHPTNPLYRIQLRAWQEVTGLQPELGEEKLSIYPNPAGDELNVSLLHGRIRGYRITNLQGRTVAEKQVTATRLLRLNQLPLAPGIYLMEVTSQAGKKYKGKVLKLND